MKKKIIYLSSLCSVKEYERLFNKYGTTSSHASQRFHRLLVRGFQENGVSVETITHRSIKKLHLDDLKGTKEQINGITYNYLSQCKFGELNRLYTIIKAYTELNRLWKKEKKMIVLVDILRGELSIAAVLFRYCHKCKIVALVTDVPIFRASETRKGLKALPIKFKNFLVSRYDNYIFLTEKMNESINKKHKPYTIIEGISEDKESYGRNKLSEKYPEKVVMMAGLLEKEYGVDDLVVAFHNIKQEDIRLHLYGKGQSVPLIKEYSLIDDRIQFGGEVLNHRIIEEERKATLLVNPRKAVGEWVEYSFPSKNIEYIASGTPMLAYELPCIPSEYKDKYKVIGEEGLEVALRECLEQEKEELHLEGCAAQKWILENKNPCIQAKKIINMLNK